MVLNYDQVEQYNDIPWLYPAEEALVVHTLCVPPEKARHGYGTKMVHYEQRFAVENEDMVIRLDNEWKANQNSRHNKMPQELPVSCQTVGDFRPSGLSNTGAHPGRPEGKKAARSRIDCGPFSIVIFG